jgi:hypothetical protein
MENENWVDEVRKLYSVKNVDDYRVKHRLSDRNVYIPPYHEDEEYRDVIENSRYEVSNYGNVRNKETGKYLKTSANSDEYPRVLLKNEKGHKSYMVHRLEAHAFFDEENIQGLQVNHKDGNKKNNQLSNLEWCTPKENVKHAFANGLVHNTEETSRKHREVFRRIYPPVRCIENGKVYPDAGVAARDLGLDQIEIRKVARGVYKSHHGYHFENADRSEINVFD